MKTVFTLVDLGCFMLETSGGRWIIEDPKNGYLPTHSKQWDVIVEHPENPHSKPLKFLGSFNTKASSVNFINNQLISKTTYHNAIAIENQFYNKDYSQK